MFHHRVLLIVAVLFSLTGSATADIPPEPDYVERCTISNQQQEGETCVLCWARFDNSEMCASLAGMGFEHRCRARGGTSWNEVWCSAPETEEGTGEGADEDEPDAAPDPTPQTDEEEAVPPTKPGAVVPSSDSSFSRANAIGALFCCALAVGASVSLRRRRAHEC